MTPGDTIRGMRCAVPDPVANLPVTSRPQTTRGRQSAVRA